MSKTKIEVSVEFLESNFQLPDGWKIVGVSLDESDNRRLLLFTVEGADIKEGVEYAGIFTTNVMEDDGGRWVQGKWDIAPWEKSQSA